MLAMGQTSIRLNRNKMVVIVRDDGETIALVFFVMGMVLLDYALRIAKWYRRRRQQRLGMESSFSEDRT